MDVRVTELLAELVAFQTESRTSNGELIDRIASQVGRARAAFHSGDAGRSNLLLSIGPDEPGGLLLTGHTDVVAAGDGWDTDPFKLSDVGDLLFGRGTADMKGFLACALVVMSDLEPTTLRRPVHLLCSYDEEIGCQGIHHALGAAAATRPGLVIVGEPTMTTPAVAHSGKVAYDVFIRTRPAHSSRARTELSAITIAAELISVLADVQTRNDDVTVNVGAIRGGSVLNVIASECRFDVELRHSTAADPNALLRPFRERLSVWRSRAADVGGAITIDEIIRYPGLATDAAHPMVKMVERVADAGAAIAVTFGTEGGLLSEATGSPVVICGPGDIAVAHRPNEYVSVQQLDRCGAFLRELVDLVCRHG